MGVGLPSEDRSSSPDCSRPGAGSESKEILACFSASGENAIQRSSALRSGMRCVVQMGSLSARHAVSSWFVKPIRVFPATSARLHRRPLAEAVGSVTTRLEDLALLCPNCHRAIHRTAPLMSVEEFRTRFFPRGGLTPRCSRRRVCGWRAAAEACVSPLPGQPLLRARSA